MSSPVEEAEVALPAEAGRESSSRRRPGRGPAGRTRLTITALAFLAPALIAIVVLRLAPAAAAVRGSFQAPGVAGGWAGLDNYQFLFSDPAFINSLLVTGVFNLVVNPLIVVLALAVALLLSQRLPGVGLWRALVFTPAAVPVAVSGVIWSVGFQPRGLINGLLQSLGLPTQPFLTSTTQALPSVMLTVVWVAVGYWMLFLIAGLQDIPRVYYEAAAVDGATWWQEFRSITLPLLRRPMAFVLVANTVGSFLVFAPVQILTRGGPQGTTDLIMYRIYQEAFLLGDLSLAQAQVVLLMLVMIVIVAIQFRLLSPKG